MVGGIESYIIGEGILNTESGNHIISFREIDEVFNYLPGTTEDLAEIICEDLCKLNIVFDAMIKDKAFDIIFLLQYCPNVIDTNERHGHDTCDKQN